MIQFQNSIKKSTNNNVEMISDSIRENFNSIISKLGYVANKSGLNNYVNNSTKTNRETLQYDFKNFLDYHKDFEQIRYINNKGKEVVRINAVGKSTRIIPENELQNKRERYYFIYTMQLKKGEIFVSNLDLSIENNEIEVPYKTMIRFSVPIFNDKGTKTGILVINYQGSIIINDIKKRSKIENSQPLLLNSSGFYLIGHNEEEEWSFMFEGKQHINFAGKYPDVWKKISSDDSGQIIDKSDMFTFKTIYPLPTDAKLIKGNNDKTIIPSSDFYWKYIDHHNSPFVHLSFSGIFILLLNNYFYVFIIVAVICFILVYFTIKQEKTASDYLKLSVAVEQSPSTIVITDTQGIIEYVNPMFTKTTGYSKKEALGKHTRILNSGNQSKDFYSNLWKTINNGNIWTGQFFNKKKNRGFYWEQASISPIFNSKHEITNFVAIKDDITKRKQLNDELVKTKEAAIEASKLKSEFLANMSHEIRTPMNAIIGFTDVLIDDLTANSEAIEKLEIIKQSGNDLVNLINDILDLSKIEAGKLEIVESDFSITKLLKNTFAMFTNKTAEKNMQFILDIDDTVPDLLCGDEIRINQICVNLISNAIKFTHAGEVKISVRYIKNRLMIKISDTGIGIDAKYKQLIFSPFKQIDGSISRNFKGTGLGLAIVKKLVHLMNGTISFISKKDQGTTFTVAIPLIRCELQPMKTNDTSIKKTIVTNNRIFKALLNKWHDDSSRQIVTNCLRSLPKHLVNIENAVRGDIKKDILFLVNNLLYFSQILKLDSISDIAVSIKNEVEKNIYEKEAVIQYVDDLRTVVSNIPEQYLKEYAKKYFTVSHIIPAFRILIAEDNYINQKLMQTIIAKTGLECDIAVNGQEALLLLEKNSYNVLFMDIEMPFLNGIEAVKIIRSQNYGDLYIIALTAYALKGDAVKFINAGFDDYMSKPINKDQLNEKLLLQIVKSQFTDIEIQFFEEIHSQVEKKSSTEIALDKEKKEKLSIILQKIKDNTIIFNPDEIRMFAEEIQNEFSGSFFEEISNSLFSAADSYTVETILPVIDKIDAFLSLKGENHE